MALKVTTDKPELQAAADELSGLIRRFLVGNTDSLATRLVGLALEIQAHVDRRRDLEEENAELRAELERLRQQEGKDHVE